MNHQPTVYRSRRHWGRLNSRKRCLFALWSVLAIIILSLTFAFWFLTPGFRSINLDSLATNCSTNRPVNGAFKIHNNGFSYLELPYPSSSIRILHIRPGKHRDLLRGSLEPVPLAHRPAFDALTYSWGDPDDSTQILVNGKKMRITSNLHDALVNIRDRSKTVPIWVDQICIDQTNLHEKSSQISLMTDIYSRAKTVRMWMGIHLAPRWVEKAHEKDWSGDWAISYAARYPRSTMYWLYRLAEEEYWKRTWIVQEVGMASNIQVHFGHQQSIPWREFIKLMEWYQQQDGKHKVHSILRLSALRETMYLDRSSFSLSYLLKSFYDSFSTVPLDKIYAFLGMANECRNGCLEVDYTKSPYEVYTDVVVTLNDSSEATLDARIHMLYVASIVRQSLERRAKRVPKTLEYFGKAADPNSYFYRDCGDEMAIHCSSEMDPSGNTSSNAAIMDSWVDGYKWMKSLVAGKKTQYTSTWLPLESETSDIWLPQSEVLRDDADESRIHVRGIITGTVSYIGPSLSSFIGDIRVARQWVTEADFYKNLQDRRLARGLNDRFGNLLSISPQSLISHVKPLKTTPTETQASPALFFGSSVMVGLLPFNAKRGDLIVQFWGSNAALVIRRGMEEQYRLIGRALVVRSDGFDWDAPKEKNDFLDTSSATVELQLRLTELTMLSLDSIKLEDQ
ncbi:Fc.00g092660.m01.CDS01 [Cosmosporella sp. VM-42]